MNAEIKSKWVAALRSGKYKQGTTCLRPNAETYCCLGVLCDVTGAGEWEAVLGGEGMHRYVKSGVGGSSALLPEFLQEVLGINWADKQDFGTFIIPAVDRDGQECTITAYNDMFEFTFPQIADLVENFI